MTVMNFYTVAIVGQKIIVKDVYEDWEVVYNGDIEHIPLKMLDRNIRWVGTSDLYVGTIEIVLE